MTGEKNLTTNIMMYVTESELNEAYCTIINQFKSGIIAAEAKRASTYIDETRKLEFMFDIALGPRGSWRVVSEFVLIPEVSEN